MPRMRPVKGTQIVKNIELKEIVVNICPVAIKEPVHNRRHRENYEAEIDKETFVIFITIETK